MDEKQEKMAQALVLLRQGYLEKLPSDIEQLQNLAAGLKGDESDREVLNDLHQRLHKIAGSGGSFGLKRLSAKARELEIIVKKWLEQTSLLLAEKDKQKLSADMYLLPELAEQVESTPVRIESPEKQKISSEQEGGERIFTLWLVEDDKTLADEMKLALAQYGYKVECFCRFEDAEEQIAISTPDLLILDNYFPNENIEASDRLVNSPLLSKDCPFIFISSLTDFYTRLRIVRLGANGFLSKPIDIPKLVEHLEHIFEDKSQAPFRIMIVDDDITLSEHYKLVLMSAGMDVTVIHEPETIIDAVSEFRPELVLMDVHMPGFSGMELAALIRQYEEWIGLPIVYLSAETDLDQQLEALGHGADDFLTKPISDAHLLRAVTVRAIRSRQLNALMSRDSLTGLLKHSRIKEELDVELARTRRNGNPLSVAMIDIDHFKRINDNYGHAVGDGVIKSVAHLLKQRFRKSDIIGRYGGEEFAVILPDCEIDMAREIIEDIRVRFEKIGFHSSGTRFNVTLSSGIATLEDSEKPEQLLVCADVALYEAKNSGRNQVCTYRK